jgi:hypothetical protein
VLITVQASGLSDINTPSSGPGDHDRSHHGPTRRRAYDLAPGGRDGPSHRRRCAHDPASGGRDGATGLALRDSDDNDGGSQLDVRIVANDGIDADANWDREDREHAGLGGDDVGIL